MTDRVAAGMGAAPVPVSEAEFAGLMDRLGGFEAAPRLAVGVSGGSDSMALCLLAARWAAQRGGRVAALGVDHRLRPAAAAEAARVGLWLAGRRIDYHVLVWQGKNPPRGCKRRRARRVIDCSRIGAATRASFICCWAIIWRTRPKRS